MTVLAPSRTAERARSPITIPGQRSSPQIASAAIPTPTGGHSAVTPPCR
jgi:hypothetical protein